MFERYSETARRTLFFSRYEASRLGEREINSEHILLGLIREEPPTVRRLFEEVGVEPSRIREEIEAGRLPETRISSSAELPLTEDSKRILSLASFEAEKLDHLKVGPEHLLLAILRLSDCAAAKILLSHGFDAGFVEAFVREAIEAAPQTPSDTPIILSDEQCEFLDRLASAIRSNTGQIASRQTLIQVILEAARSSKGFLEINSFEELVRRVSEGPKP